MVPPDKSRGLPVDDRHSSVVMIVPESQDMTMARSSSNRVAGVQS